MKVYSRAGFGYVVEATLPDGRGVVFELGGKFLYFLEETETDTTTQTVPYSTNCRTRTWTYTWDATRLLLSINDPLNKRRRHHHLYLEPR
jgi:YD repeat-containing protein